MRKIIFSLLIYIFLFPFYTFSQPKKSEADINPILLNSIWKASWIAPSHTSLNKYGIYLFRRSIELQSRPEKFIIHISADNHYWLYVNGVRTIIGPARGDTSHWRFETIDLAPYLQKGKNTIAAEVWNFGEYRAWGQISLQTGFLIQGNSDVEEILNTDESWKVCENHAYTPLFEDYRVTGARELIMGEQYPWNWQLPLFDDHNWENAVKSEKAIPDGVTGEGKRRLVPRNIPQPEEKMQRFSVIRRSDRIATDNGFIKGTKDLVIGPWGNGTIMIDQSYLTTAFPEIIISGGKGSRIILSYMEAPYIDVKKGIKGNRNETDFKKVAGIYDIIMPDGGDHRLYRPLYYRTFRYVQITVENYFQPLIIHDFYSKFTAYPFQENASFNSSDESLKEIWNVGWRTARLCAFETYMDCPYYEQYQYIGDARIQALISLYVSGDDRLMRNAIQQFYDSKMSEGLTKSRYPDYLDQVIPPFSLFWTVMINDYRMHRTDDDFIRSFVPVIRSVLNWHKKYIDPKTGMLGVMPYWNFVDWPNEWSSVDSFGMRGVPEGGNTGNSSILTLQYVYALQKSGEVLSYLNFKKDAGDYLELAENLKKSVYSQCWDEKKKMIADSPEKIEYSQHANVLAVLTGTIRPDDEKDLMIRVISDSNLVQCTIYYRFYLNQAMKKAGLADQYIEMLTPWKNMINMGLTTFAERPEPSRSDCHGWSASPVYDLLATVCGIVPDHPGFKTVIIKPAMGNLQWIECKMPHPDGEIKVSLKKTGDRGVEGEITLPAGITGSFIWQDKTIKLKSGNQKIRL